MYEKLYMVSPSMKQEAYYFSGGCVTKRRHGRLGVNSNSKK
jgi:hypothetical protein